MYLTLLFICLINSWILDVFPSSALKFRCMLNPNLTFASDGGAAAVFLFFFSPKQKQQTWMRNSASKNVKSYLSQLRNLLPVVVSLVCPAEQQQKSHFCLSVREKKLQIYLRFSCFCLFFSHSPFLSFFLSLSLPSFWWEVPSSLFLFPLKEKYIILKEFLL